MEQHTANRVELLRTLKGKSQKAIAAEMGITQTCYSKLERNWQKARLDTLERLARALGTTAARLTDTTLSVEELANE